MGQVFIIPFQNQPNKRAKKITASYLISPSLGFCIRKVERILLIFQGRYIESTQ